MSDRLEPEELIDIGDRLLVTGREGTAGVARQTVARL